MQDSDSKYKITQQIISDLRKRLLDTRPDNPLINFSFSKRSRTYIRVINEFPDALYSKLIDGKTLTFASVSQIQKTPSDEQVDTLQMRLQPVRLSVTEKDLPSVTECAKQMGINPSFELPLPDEKKDGSVGNSETIIQTLLFPDQMDRKLSGLFNQIRISLSEMGVNTLYCAWGFLEWFESDDSDIPFFAPLVLLQLQMEQILVRQTYRYSIKATGDKVEINLTLREKLRQDFAMELPLFEETDTPESYFTKISEMIEEKSRWRVRRFITIGKLSFSRLVMYNDLDQSRWPDRPLHKHKVLSDLLGGVEHDGPIIAEEYLADSKDVSAIVPILITNADSSQFSAIVDAMKGKNLAIQGPPGTGKSQTITNVIAAALFANKKVLFLSEKMAALEVVKKRLDEAGLGDFCLELHSTKAQKKPVLDSLKKRLLVRPTSPDYYLPLKEEREKLQDQLNEYAIKMNQPYGKTGKTVTEIVWAEQCAREKAAGYKITDSLSLLDERSSISMTMMNLDERLSKLRTIEEAYCLVTLKYGSLTKHPWYGINGAGMSVFDQGSTVRELTRWLLTITQIAEAAQKMSRLLEITEIDLTIDYVTNLLTQIKENVFVEKLEIDANLISNLRNQQTLQEVDRLILDCQNYNAKYNELCDYVVNPEKVSGQEIPQTDQFINGIGKLVLHETVDVDSLKIPAIRKLFDNLQSTSLKLRKYLLLANEWRQLMGYAKPLTVVEVQSMLAAIQLQIRTPREIIIRRTKELTDELSKDILERGKALAYRCITKQIELEKRFTLNLEDDPQRLRRLSYTIRTAGMLHKFGSNYRNAVKAYLFLLRPELPKPRPLQMASDLLAIAELLEEIQRLNNDTQLRSVAGLYFHGFSTDFATLQAVNEYGASVRRQFNSNSKLDKCIQQFLLEESIDILDTFQATVKGLDINEFQYYIDSYVFQDPNKDIDKICGEYDEAASCADALYTNLSAMTVKEHVSFQEITALARIKLELDHIISSISDNTIAKLALGNHFKGPNSRTELICSTSRMAKRILGTKLPGACISKLLSSEFNLIYFELSSIAKGLEKLISDETEIRSTIINTQRVDLCLFLGNTQVEKIKIKDILERLHKVVDNPEDFIEWTTYCQARQEIMELGMGQILDIYLQPDGSSAPLHLADAYEWVFYRSLVRNFYNDFPQFKQFSGLNHESLRQRFTKLDREIIVLQQRMLARKLASNPIKSGIGSGPRSGWTDLSLIQNEIARIQNQIGKKRRGSRLPLRDLLMRASDAVLAMKPCFMMSPASVAQFISPDSSTEFDIVIIDEASQMKPEEALGAIARGRQLIVVGDPKQLPPNSFFDRTDFPDDEDDKDMEDYIDMESILDLSLATFRPSRNLKWHYRSRHESLIAFSNKNFYDSSLILFPSSKAKHRDFGIEYRFVSGVYRGHTNILEAQEVIAAAKEFMYTYPDRSLGIVTMNIHQMEMLNAELELLFSHDHRCEEYRIRWASTLEPLFAKNLENVQGDERDVIFISTLYGPTETGGKVMQRFGPVNSGSGSRRLNVLFTRAKEKVVVFSSMKSTDIIPTDVSQGGAGVLKAYLEYARTGQLESGKESGREPGSDFEISVGDRLRRCGYEVVPQVGVAGYFIDLGVKDPNNLDSYILGIECDGRGYHSAKSARDRDRLRKEVLEAMGWRIHNIWSLDWFQDPEGQMKRLLDHLEKLSMVTAGVAIKDSKDSEDNVQEEDYRKTQRQDRQTHSAVSLPENINSDTAEISIPTPDTGKIDISNTAKSPQMSHVNTIESEKHFSGTKIRKETMQIEIVLVKEKETPGTWRFKENKEDHPMTIYLTKEQVKELGDPKSIKVAITAA